jgi:hypothetical protein
MFPVYPGKRTPNCDCGVHLSKVDPSATSPARDSGPVQPRQHVRPRNRDDQNTDDQHEGDGEGRDVGMISRVVHDLLLRPVVGALPFTERFTSPALTSFIGDPGWCVLHQSLASGRALNFIGSTSGPLTTKWPLIIRIVRVVIVAPGWARQNARRSDPSSSRAECGRVQRAGRVGPASRSRHRARRSVRRGCMPPSNRMGTDGILAFNLLACQRTPPSQQRRVM